MLTENVSVNYGAIEALTGVSMHVEGEVVTLIGANGAGKTTTLRTITGLLQPRQACFRRRRHQRQTHAQAGRARDLDVARRTRRIREPVRPRNLQMGAYLKNNKSEIAADMERAFKMFPRLKGT